MKDDFPSLASAVLIAATFTMSILWLADSAASRKFSQCPKAFKTVANLGGCSAFGMCNVIYTDGSFGNIKAPTPGKTYEVCK